MSDHDPALALFLPPIRQWFCERLGAPTEVQRLAWPRIAAGEHVLVSAPTGSGKTLAAFLWAVDQLLDQRWQGGAVRVLYVSPLRALGNDIRRNLLGPLAELEPYFAAFGLPMPRIRVETRTGDTPPEDRRRMLRHPPEILITTPESLNILLTATRSRSLLGELRTVILDEVHAVAGSKRGVHLITAVERLVPLAGELQRVALSATVQPMERIGRWVGGLRLAGGRDEPSFERRTVSLVEARASKVYDIEVRMPAGTIDDGQEPAAFWNRLADDLTRVIRRNRSTLLFANSRRMVEKLARLVNHSAGEQLAYSHHGALSREIRAAVEERLKAGQLKAIVATNTLELGIDIGAVDEVELIQSPHSVASTVQRLGRAGHSVGEISRGRFYPLHPRDLLKTAVLVTAVGDGEVEPLRPVRGALDVLAQVVVSMVASETWTIDELHAVLRTSEPYHDLPRRQLDLVLDLLGGRYASTRIRSLRPLVAVDRIDETVRARAGAARLLYLSGGTIPDRGYFHLRMEGSGAAIGELDEEFVWERSAGDAFTLGVQCWRIERITSGDVFVTPARASAAMAPFWRAEERDRSVFLSERIASFLEAALPRLEDAALASELVERHRLSPPAAAALLGFLRAQREATGTLPHRHQLVVEHTTGSSGRSEHRQVILHTCWGGRVNRPLAYAIAGALAEQLGLQPEIYHDDDCISLSYPSQAAVSDPLALVPPEEIEGLLRRHLESTGFFGARFREAAGVALLLPRSGFRRRTPLWLNRQRAKELLAATADAEDFPIVLEAWRACLQDELDLEALRGLLEEVRDGRISVVHVHTEAPSPFASSLLWKQTNTLMYADDTPAGRGGTRVRPDLLREVVLAPHLRPRLARRLVEELAAKLQRTAPGYAPSTALDLLDWVGERVLMTIVEWRCLLAAVERDHGVDPVLLVQEIGDRVVAVAPRSRPQAPWLVSAVQDLPRLLLALGRCREDIALVSATLDGSPAVEAAAALSRLAEPPVDQEDPGEILAELLAHWLTHHGPVPLAGLPELLPVEDQAIDRAVEALVDGARVVSGELTEGATEPEVCDAENLERLLRMARRAQRSMLEPRPVGELPLLLACQQGLGEEPSDLARLQEALERLFVYSAPAGLWESDILPARLDAYQPGWLDALLLETDLEWFGCGARRLGFALAADRDLWEAGREASEPIATEQVSGVLPESVGRYTFEELLAATDLDSAALAERLWQLAWDGRATSDSFAPVRQGAAAAFKVSAIEPARPAAPGRRGRFDRWRGSRPFAGTWRRLPEATSGDDILEREELARECARLVLDRYGVVFRELLERELPGLRWGDLFRALRLLELSGEAVGGLFFTGVSGLQFASHAALRRIEEGLPEDRVWWLSAADPASPCGLGLAGLDQELPRRVPTNHLVMQGSRLVVVSERGGKRLLIRVAADHPRLGDYLSFLKVLLTRAVAPVKAITVEEVNGQPAASSPYREALTGMFHVTRTHTALRLARRY